MNFTVLCIDNNEMVNSKTIKSLCLSFQANDILWDGNIQVEDNKITSESGLLSIEFTTFDTSDFAVGERCIPAYTLTINSNDYDVIEPFRMKVIDHLKEMKFSHIRILHDDISKEIACKMYPLLYSIENELREFITYSLVKKIGADFWQYVVDKKTREDTKRHIDNEPHFIGSKKIVGDVMLLYFDALGKIVFGEATVFTQVNDILEKVRQAIDLNKLKRDLLESNFQKYFKDCFEKSDFQSKWTKLNLYRNKVAHNSYFLHCDLTETERLTNELSEIINTAYSKVDMLKLSVSDMEALKKAIDDVINETQIPIPSDKQETNDSYTVYSGEKVLHISRNSECATFDSPYKSIDEKTLLEILNETSSRIPFVGLKYFVKEILGGRGYAYDSSYALINILIDKGILITEKKENPTGGHETTSIKFLISSKS